MSRTSIPVDESTKSRLDELKGRDETWDEFLERIAVDRSEQTIREMAGGGGEGLAEHMEEKREELNESLDGRRED